MRFCTFQRRDEMTACSSTSAAKSLQMEQRHVGGEVYGDYGRCADSKTIAFIVAFA